MSERALEQLSIDGTVMAVQLEMSILLRLIAGNAVIVSDPIFVGITQLNQDLQSLNYERRLINPA